MTCKFFKCKTKLIGTTADDNSTLNRGVAVPLKYLNKFWDFSVYL